MRNLLALWFLLVLAVPATAQDPYAYVEIDPPSYDVVIVIHPSHAARIFAAPGSEWHDPFDVQVAHADFDPYWGLCTYLEPMVEAQELILVPTEFPDDFVLLEEPLLLDAPPSSEDGWTTVALQQLRGGGHTDGSDIFVAIVPGFGGCWENRVELTMRSADINADLAVNLTDIVLFSQAFLDYGVYHAWADLWPDGTINLSDLVVFSQAID
jgi:hypothetical protein